LLGDTFAQTKPPRFEDYPVSSTFKGKAARLNLQSHPQARRFRTMLRRGVKRGVKFAGHYAVNSWGCGSRCIRVGIVNLKTGRAYVSPFYIGYGISYRLDSRLFIAEPPEITKEYFGDDVPYPAQPRYYVWRNNRLILIYPKEDRNDEAEKSWQ
jgi:hypothetical protein